MAGNPRAELRLVTSKTSYHPKLYCFFTDTEATMIAGSANLTRGGLESNFEASLSVGARLADPVVQDLNQFRLRVHASSEKATEIGIAEYEKRFG